MNKRTLSSEAKLLPCSGTVAFIFCCFSFIGLDGLFEKTFKIMNNPNAFLPDTNTLDCNADGCHSIIICLHLNICCKNSHICISVKRDVDMNNEESVKVKENAILELGELLAQTNQPEGNYFLASCCKTV